MKFIVIKKYFLALFIIVLSAPTIAQTKLNIFSTDGYKFYLIVNGLKVNNKATERVEKTLQGSEKYFVKIIFSNPELPDLDEVFEYKDSECINIDYSIIKLGDGKDTKTKLVKSSEIICSNGLSGIWVAQIDGGIEFDTIKIVDNKATLSFFTKLNGKMNNLETTVKPRYELKEQDTTAIVWTMYFYDLTENNLNLSKYTRANKKKDECNRVWCDEYWKNSTSINSRTYTISIDYRNYKSGINLFNIIAKESYTCISCQRHKINAIISLDFKMSFRLQ